MALIRAARLLALALFAAASAASGISYITDIPAFTSLAPCAASAISYAVQSMTRSQCPPDETALESCACTKDSNAAVLQSTISSLVLYSCSTTATDDVVSASSVFSRYCHQNAADSSVPSKTLVSQFITDLDAFTSLAACAQSGLSYAVMTLTDNSCPPAASALASCACSKNQNSAAAMTRIKIGVQSSCGTTHTEDVTSAQAIFAGYCGMNTGVTSFPAAPSLSGSLSYYVTDLPTFTGLAPCAASAVSEGIMDLTSSFCAADPNALVSCVCTKDKNQQFVSSVIASGVSQLCSSTASEDVTSALDVFDFYCSAGNGLVVPTGVTASATGGRGGALPTGSRGIPKPTPSPTSAATDGGSGPGVNVKITGNGSKLGIIVGSVVGGIALVIIALVIWFCLRRRSKRRAAPMPITANPAADTDNKEAVELHRYSKISSPVLKTQDLAHRVPGVQYASEMQGSNAATSPYPSKSELVSPGGYSAIYPSNKSELASPGGQSSLYPPNKSELPTPTGQYPQYPPTHPQEIYGRPMNQAYDLGYNPARLNEGPMYEMYAPHNR